MQMRKTIFKLERDQTKVGRTINALLAFLTANRYALIFTFRITLVKRAYQPESIRKRITENLLTFLILFPFVMGLILMHEKCTSPDPKPIIPTDTIRTEPEKPKPTGM